MHKINRYGFLMLACIALVGAFVANGTKSLTAFGISLFCYAVYSLISVIMDKGHRVEE